jgi:hypothetical protein
MGFEIINKCNKLIIILNYEKRDERIDFTMMCVFLVEGGGI